MVVISKTKSSFTKTQYFLCVGNLTQFIAGESQVRAPGHASGYALRAPNPPDSRTYDQMLCKQEQ